MLLKGSAQPVMWMLQQMNSSTHCSKMMKTGGIQGNILPYILPPWKNVFISEVSNGKTLSYHRLSPSMLHIPMVMMLHTLENTVDNRLDSFGMTAGKLVPDETSTRIQRLRKESNFMRY